MRYMTKPAGLPWGHTHDGTYTEHGIAPIRSNAARLAAWYIARRDARRANHQCRQCGEALPTDYRKRTCSTCLLNLSSQKLSRRGRGKYY